MDYFTVHELHASVGLQKGSECESLTMLRFEEVPRMAPEWQRQQNLRIENDVNGQIEQALLSCQMLRHPLRKQIFVGQALERVGSNVIDGPNLYLGVPAVVSETLSPGSCDEVSRARLRGCGIDQV